MPPKMKFESPVFHPNSKPASLPLCGLSMCGMILRQSLSLSLSQRRSLHFHPTPAGRGQVRLRVCRRALVPRSNAGNHPAVRDLYALESERRKPGQRGGRPAMEGRPGRVQETCPQVRTRESRGGLSAFTGVDCIQYALVFLKAFSTVYLTSATSGCGFRCSFIQSHVHEEPVKWAVQFLYVSMVYTSSFGYFFFFVGMEFTALKGCGVELIHSHYGVIA